MVTVPPNGYPDPYGVPEDGSPCRRPPNGFGTDYWGLCLPCGLKEHHVNGKIVDTVYVDESNNRIGICLNPI